METSELLKLTVLAAIVTTVGNLAATFIKEALLVRSFEKWKAKQSAAAVYRRFRDPLVLSSRELLNRVEEIVYQAPVGYLDADLLEQRPREAASPFADDKYYQRYKLVSTVYRLCAWFGWTELYRRSVTFLDSGSSKANQRFETQVQKVRSDLADGHLNAASDWSDWTDALIFREEQRAVGESMIPGVDSSPAGVYGYAAFCRSFEAEDSSGECNWLRTASNFVLNLKTNARAKDFRRVRCLRMICHLTDLIAILDSSRVTAKMKELRLKASSELNLYAVDEPI